MAGKRISMHKTREIIRVTVNGFADRHGSGGEGGGSAPMAATGAERRGTPSTTLRTVRLSNELE